MNRRSKGLTLAEALVTLALVIFVLNLTAGLLQSYLRAAKFAGGVDKSMEAAQTAVTSIRNEASTAVSFISPDPSGGRADRLVFEKVWQAPGRLPDPDAPFPATWEPHDPGWMDRVEYSLAREMLRRTSAKERARSVMVADQVSEFQTEFLSNGNLVIEISTRQDKITKKVTSEVFLGVMR